MTADRRRSAPPKWRLRMRHTGVLVLGTALLSAAGPGLSIGAAHAQTGLSGSSLASAYTLTAAADNASIEVDAAKFPLLAPQVAYFSSSTAQSELDSFGGSASFCGAPFLGQTVEGVGGLISGLGAGGTLPPLPQNLPGYVAASNPADPSESESMGPYTLDASASANSSKAVAGIAAVDGKPMFLSSKATAVTSANPDGSLEALAQSLTQPFSIGGLLSIGTVQATARMAVNSQGQLDKSSSLDLGTITIAGFKVGLTQKGLQALGTSAAIPSTSAVNALLAAAGLSITFLPASETATSVTSAGVQIRETHTVPVEGDSGLVITFGQAIATLRYQQSPDNPGAGTGSTIPSASGSGQGSSSAGESSGAVPSTGAAQPSAPQVIPVPANSLSTSIGPGGEQGPTSSDAAPALGTRAGTVARIDSRLEPDAIRWYLVLVLAGLALTAASRLASALAVKRHKSHRPAPY